jgi:NAD(P)-dependent dehydrogenase (short-subunit alcohol dehydrogenase family)
MPVALITGARRGLGFEFVRQYVDDGWRVFAACRDPKSASELQRLPKDAGGKLAIVAMDVTDSKSVHAAAAQLKDAVAVARRRWSALQSPRRAGHYKWTTQSKDDCAQRGAWSR